MKGGSGSKVESLVLGFILITLGALFLVHNFTPVNIFPHIWKLWPLILIILGTTHLIRWLSRSAGAKKAAGSWTIDPLAAQTITRPRRFRGKELVLVLLVILVGLAVSRVGTRRGGADFELPFRSGSLSSVTRDLARPLELGPGDTLRLINEYGDLEVTDASGENPKVSCRLTARAEKESEAQRQIDDAELTVEVEGSHTTVNLHLPPSDRAATELRASMEVRVPAGIHVQLDSRNGDVDVTGLEADLHIRAAGEGVKVKDVAGAVDVLCGRGRVAVDRAGGPVTISSGGGIKVNEVAGDLTLECRGGSIEAREVTGRAMITSHDGRRLTLAGIGGGVVLELHGGKARLEEITGPVQVSGHKARLALHNCYDEVALDGTQLEIETHNIRRDLTIDAENSELELENTLGSLVVRVENGSLTSRGKLYDASIQGSFSPITLLGCEGNLEIVSRQGEVTLRKLSPPRAAGVTVEGVGANVILELSADSCDYSLVMTAMDGAITSLVAELEISVTETGGPGTPLRGTAVCGNGSRRVSLKTDHGEIRLEPLD